MLLVIFSLLSPASRIKLYSILIIIKTHHAIKFKFFYSIHIHIFTDINTLFWLYFICKNYIENKVKF